MARSLCLKVVVEISTCAVLGSLTAFAVLVLIKIVARHLRHSFSHLKAKGLLKMQLLLKVIIKVVTCTEDAF